MLGSAALLSDSRKRALARITWWASMVGSALGVFTCRGFFLDCFTCKTVNDALKNTSQEAESQCEFRPADTQVTFSLAAVCFSLRYFSRQRSHTRYQVLPPIPPSPQFPAQPPQKWPMLL